MKANEIYSGKENWDLSPDTRVTLHRDTESLYGSQGRDPEDEEKNRRQEAEKESRRKKLLTKGMALFVSAAVMTGVLSGGSRSHSEDGSDVAEFYICPVCNTINCQFYDEGRQYEYFPIMGNGGERYSSGYQGYGIYSLVNRGNYSMHIDGICMKDGRRAVLGPRPARIADEFRGTGYNPMSHYESAFFAQDDLTIHGLQYWYGLPGDGSSFVESEYGGLIQLVYYPDGILPDTWDHVRDWMAEYNVEDSFPDLRYSAVRPVEGEPCLWLRSYSNYSQESAEQAVQNSTVEIWDAGNEFALGEQLRFTENDRVKISGAVHQSGASVQLGKCELGWDVSGCEYTVFVRAGERRIEPIYRICAEGCSFEEICEQTDERIKQARERGHLTPARFVKLDRISVNGMDYTVYLYAYTDESDERMLRSSFFISPDKDPRIALELSAATVVGSETELSKIENLTTLKNTAFYRENECTSVMDLFEKMQQNNVSPQAVLECIRER